VRVRDSGRGIPPEELQRINERLREDSPSRVSKSGLGLTLARKIAVAHRGSIEVASAVGEGATFVVRLPVYGKALPRGAAR
jgi:signal transduction histidine kinase